MLDVLSVTAQECAPSSGRAVGWTANAEPHCAVQGTVLFHGKAEMLAANKEIEAPRRVDVPGLR